jgi:hypothetical protein
MFQKYNVGSYVTDRLNVEETISGTINLTNTLTVTSIEVPDLSLQT